MSTSNISLDIGEKIKRRRQELGYTQSFLSSRLDSTQNAISNIEKGKAWLNVEKLIEISKILKVDLNYFVEIDSIDQKDERIQELENIITRLEKRNEILETYIIKFIDPKTT